MKSFTPAEYRQVHDDPTALVLFSQAIAASKDTETARGLDTLVVRTQASLTLDHRWDALEAFNTSLLHSVRAFERAAEAGWPEGRQIVAGWETLLRLGEACLAMARDEKAIELVKSSDTYEAILRALGRSEPLPSGELARELGKSAQRISNVLGDMEEHGLISRHCVGRSTLVWLGPAGHYYLQKEAQAGELAVASKSEFDKRYESDAKRLTDTERNPLRNVRGALYTSYQSRSEPLNAAG